MSHNLQKLSISDGHGLSVDLLNYGARICAIDFHRHQLALGLDRLEDYLDEPFYLGATIGPITNRIAHGRLTVNNELLQMTCNEGKHSLHSGGAGFDKHFWQLESHSPNQICFSLDYDMADVGLKGRLTTMAIYRVTDGCLTIKYRSSCDLTCFINLTNHVYLNLSSLDTISDHQFQLNADSFVIVDTENIPTGELRTLNKPLEYHLEQSLYPEFIGQCDHHFNTPATETDGVREMLNVVSPDSGISLTVSSNSPGFQFCTGRFLSAPFAPSGGFCVETQLAPDAINQASFYSPLLNPNQQVEQITQYQFSRASIA